MPLTHYHRRVFTAWYCVVFYVLMLYKCWNEMWLFQLQPHLYNTRPDAAAWIVMRTGIHTWLLDNKSGWLLFDLAFYAMPLIYWIMFNKSLKAATAAALVMLGVNCIYVTCYTLYPANSIESFTPWLLFPLLLATRTLVGFYYVMHALRYFFLFFFVSAALWKVAQAGLFNTGQMSGVLLFQHKEYLASSPGGGYSDMVYWLVHHAAISYVLYIAAAIFEFTFIIGFFTRKYDPILIALFFIFIIMDIVVMRIPYWEILPLVLPLCYSRYKAPAAYSAR